MFAVCCLLFVVCCLSSVVCCLLFAACCLLLVVCCWLVVVCRLSFVDCCLLFVVCCLLLVVCCCYRCCFLSVVAIQLFAPMLVVKRKPWWQIWLLAVAMRTHLEGLVGQGSLGTGYFIVLGLLRPIRCISILLDLCRRAF